MILQYHAELVPICHLHSLHSCSFLPIGILYSPTHLPSNFTALVLSLITIVAKPPSISQPTAHDWIRNSSRHLFQRSTFSSHLQQSTSATQSPADELNVSHGDRLSLRLGVNHQIPSSGSFTIQTVVLVIWNCPFSHSTTANLQHSRSNRRFGRRKSPPLSPWLCLHKISYSTSPGMMDREL